MIGESMSVRYADRVVADADVIASYYRTSHRADPTVIAYGAEFPEEADTDILARLGVASGEYLLYVSRLEPENNPLGVIEGYRNSQVSLPLLMVGSAPYSGELIRQLKALESGGVRLPGAIYGADYRTLQRNARLYIQATEVGGTHPALIEAMGSGGAVAALATPENTEVGGDAVLYFELHPRETLSKILVAYLDDFAALNVYRTKARSRVAARYSWERVTDEYEKLFSELASQ
jgi:glycosyltransferase involved in cell wall biosynthesis